MTDPKTVLSVEGVSVDTIPSGAKPIVRNIGFTVAEGETVCIVGESGSGKSVTSMAIMGLLPKDALRVTAGRILLDGEDILTASPARMRELRAARVAMVFQEPMTALNPVRTVGDQIDEVLRLHTKLPPAERKKRVLTMLERVHMPDVDRIYRSYPHELSGGQRQRIVIAMALILRPRLLLADEPTTALDVTTQKQILHLIKELQEQEKTAVIFVTHDFGVVSEIADRIVVMNRGDLVETGSRDAILTNPQQDYTRMLVASVPSLIPRRDPVDTGPKVLEVVGLDKRYGKKSMFSDPSVMAAQGIGFTVRKGEITGIIGESGSGKSTVARCVMRLTDPTDGAVIVNGTDIASARNLKTVRKQVQYIFQDPYRSLNPRRTIGQSLMEGLVNYGMPEAEARRKVGETLELVNLPAAVMSRYPHQFSGGQRQRLAIARAVVMEPDLLIADEAVSALDVTVQAQVLRLFEDIRDRTGIAILFITHDLRVAAQICNTVVVMQRGRIVEQGAAKDVLAHPAHAYTRALIDAAPAPDWDFQNFRPAVKVS
ncbi:dipeptide ABC transporter ATP-binding protein [Paracoccus shanxieyensis]|uniref:Dipeptide ABC transporter ATP-binding protein n=1 Tax=Paracoccus shanxieyensis TaxID=2675752 RepID=A0A6L6J3S9_9RHOB|nr:ABC transporter ATP-binding protein [Paracoccus shanxieyensis]MTH65920.1 dipeptide ABC transporter ATP-binding protein [Paracoccus shanxieyensis]MTH89171.1 dipeptide ABC transporter ATP-binding protein [Paracoccus shanxieyensis]